MCPLLVPSLTLLPGMTPAQTLTGIDWQLLAIDGALTDTRTTLRIEDDGTLAGAAPCNRWSAMNTATLPSLKLGPIRATRMACDRLAEEQAFFDALSVMTSLTADGDRNLILTGPDGRSMEFGLDGAACKTCKPGG
jgi:heat shock protein HslJ